MYSTRVPYPTNIIPPFWLITKSQTLHNWHPRNSELFPVNAAEHKKVMGFLSRHRKTHMRHIFYRKIPILDLIQTIDIRSVLSINCCTDFDRTNSLTVAIGDAPCINAQGGSIVWGGAISRMGGVEPLISGKTPSPVLCAYHSKIISLSEE